MSLCAMFLEAAARHGNSAQTHGNREVRHEEARLAECAFANALCCRNLTKQTRDEIVHIRNMWRRKCQENM